MSVTQAANEIRAQFDFLEDWEDRYAHIIDLGRANPPLSPDERTETTRVRGCASQVWMVTQALGDGKIGIRAESDAVLVSGLIAILLQLYSGQHAADIVEFDAHSFFREIGVSDALTAQRSNGLASMLDRIRADAARLGQA